MHELELDDLLLYACEDGWRVRLDLPKAKIAPYRYLTAIVAGRTYASNTSTTHMLSTMCFGDAFSANAT
ncbi:hypothetical protein LTR95_008471 [Oleoguttula sp. CCFEE 5521]